MPCTILRSVLICCLMLLAFSSKRALAEDAPAFPADPAKWINSPPLTVQQMGGKGVFLWFFEETCPSCREKWPGLMEKANKYADKPVVFIAVNSGNSPAEVSEYANSVRCRWPMIVDVDRSFEKACGVKEISLQNIHQAYYISADGKLHRGNWDEIDATVGDALNGAAWKLDPAEIPPALKDTWRAFEFGNYKGGAPSLKKSLASKKPEVQEAAQKLWDAAEGEVKAKFTAAQEAHAAEQNWKAFELCQFVGDRFNGFDMPEEFADLKKDLQKDSQVKAGLVSRKALEGTRKALNNGKPLSKKARTQLEKVVSDFADTDLARDAQLLLKQGDGAE